ncbi:hypothetical protein Ac42p081 [Acinetobacter phage Ac42]|uniref:hypothetical protein n=1 Tax=Acinetobacter phage Ac42 TaxID=762660 RepID=UPI0001EBCCEB|nr:hypothetical protein Ac42p081 [Acinetobacter phage Ac42]ADI96319.1 hypothetical protein Ac42p081 [Acinetobacter phage Ac42]
MHIKSLTSKLRECPNGFNYLKNADDIVKDTWHGLLNQIDRDRFHNSFVFKTSKELSSNACFDEFRVMIDKRFKYHMTRDDSSLLTFKFEKNQIGPERFELSCITTLTRKEV